MVLEPLVIHLKHNKQLNVKKETLKFYKKIVNAFRPWGGESLSKYNTKSGGYKRKD